MRDAVVARWGPDVAPGGTVDRAAVARHAFAAPAERAWLEGLLWPRVGARVAAWRAVEAARDAAAARRSWSRRRCCSRPGWRGSTTLRWWSSRTRGSARGAPRRAGTPSVDERTARQLSQDEKAARADHVVRNDRDLAALEQELAAVLEKLH